MGWGVTGWLIVSRQPRNIAGWLFCIGAAATAVAGLATAYTIYGVRLASSPLPGQGQVALVADYSFLVVALIPLLVLLFPDGHPPSARWRWAVWVLLAGIGVAAIAYALTPGPAQQLRRVRDPVRESVRGRRVRRGAPGQRPRHASARS